MLTSNWLPTGSWLVGLWVVSRTLPPSASCSCSRNWKLWPAGRVASTSAVAVLPGGIRSSRDCRACRICAPASDACAAAARTGRAGVTPTLGWIAEMEVIGQVRWNRLCIMARFKGVCRVNGQRPTDFSAVRSPVLNQPLLDAVALRCERGGRLLFDDLSLSVAAGESLQIGGVLTMRSDQQSNQTLYQYTLNET